MKHLATLLLATLLLAGILPTPVAAAGLPVATADPVTTLEDTGVVVTVSAQDDTGNDPIDSFAVDTPPTSGSVGAFSTPVCTGITPPVCTATITYTPDSNTNGPDSFTFTATDAVADTSAPATASIAVTAVNDAPSFTKGANQVALEDSGAHSISTWATAISAGPSDEVGQVVSFVIDTNDNPGLFSAGPAVSASGTLTYTPTANANGSAAIALHIHDTGGTANGGANTSAIQSFTITVTAVNDPPTATDDALTVAEDAAATIVNVLGNDSFAPDTGETLSVSAVGAAAHGTTSLVSGAVRYAPAANYAGTDSFTYTLSDGNGGTDTGTVNVTVTAVNDAPSFTKGANEVVLEDAGTQAVNGWATALSPGGGVDEAGQALSFAIDSNGNSALFSVQPAVSSAGTLSYTPAANANGSATIVLHVADDGGTANGGDDASATQTLVISVTAVNDAPTFTSGGDVSAAEDSGLQTVSGWATAISPGPGESGQAVAFAISNVADPSLFAVQPTIDANGTLTFRAASNRSGLSTLDIVLGDNGGTANGGSNTSAPVTITITISGANDAPIASNDLASVRLTGPTAINVRANDSAGPNEPGDTYLITSVKEGSRGIVTITGGGTGLTYD
ncbi:MAG: Ig-like domain-containing protein, partial [Candidatus Limnocylindrales bacterium]